MQESVPDPNTGDLRFSSYLAALRQSRGAKFAIPLGMLSVVRAGMLWGSLAVLLILGVFAVVVPLGYGIWRMRGGGPFPDRFE